MAPNMKELLRADWNGSGRDSSDFLFFGVVGIFTMKMRNFPQSRLNGM